MTEGTECTELTSEVPKDLLRKPTSVKVERVPIMAVTSPKDEDLVPGSQGHPGPLRPLMYSSVSSTPPCDTMCQSITEGGFITSEVTVRRP